MTLPSLNNIIGPNISIFIIILFILFIAAIVISIISLIKSGKPGRSGTNGTPGTPSPSGTPGDYTALSKKLDDLTKLVGKNAEHVNSLDNDNIKKSKRYYIEGHPSDETTYGQAVLSTGGNDNKIDSQDYDMAQWAAIGGNSTRNWAKLDTTAMKVQFLLAPQ
jgi:hypothetical protein